MLGLLADAALVPFDVPPPVVGPGSSGVLPIVAGLVVLALVAAVVVIVGVVLIRRGRR